MRGGIVNVCILICAGFLAGPTAWAEGKKAAERESVKPLKPVVTLSHANNTCATFYWKNTPDYYVGYRFMEGNPDMLPMALTGYGAQPAARFGPMPANRGKLRAQSNADPFAKGWLTVYEESDNKAPRQLKFRAFADGSAWAEGLDNNGKQKREFFYLPVEYGVRMWMKLTTTEDIAGACLIQQCLRYSGKTNKAWRQPVALISFLSEYDSQAAVQPNQSLSWARTNGQWMRFPVQNTQYNTPPGRPFDRKRFDDEIDHGLIVRESLDEAFASGMYWERTAYVSNRHPADCLHSSVDFGPLKAGESRTVQGAFYFVEGTKDDVLAMFRRDFEPVTGDE